MSRKDRQEQRRRRRLRREKRQSAPPPGEIKMPPRFMMERSMREMFGEGGGGRQAEAQDLAYQAMEADDIEQIARLAMQAVKLDPHCLDALLLLAQLGSESREELIENLRKAVKTGERELGEQCFEEDRGYFWGLLETRPYMRARALLAEALADAGRFGEAIAEYEAMLDLNPGDNQGLRYHLIGCYLAADRVQQAGKFLEKHKDDPMAAFAWARVLQRHLAGDLDGAKAALAKARETNRHMEAYLAGRKRLPDQMPGYYGVGDENEAVISAKILAPAWKDARSAVRWLRQME